MAEDSLTVAAAQFTPHAGDVVANREIHLLLAARAAAHGARLLVFPELSLTGYELEAADALAFTPEDPDLEALAAAAKRHDILLVAGLPLRRPDGLRVAAVLVPPEGPPSFREKGRLGTFPPRVAVDGAVPPSETRFFGPGTRDEPFEIGDRTLALGICADTGDPDHAARARARGAEIYLASLFVPPSEWPAESRHLATLARTIGLPLLAANFSGTSGGLRAAGRSTAWDAQGRILAALPEDGAGLVLLTRDGGGSDRARTERVAL